MRAAIVVTLAVALAMGATLAQAEVRPEQQAALAPGKPAGVTQAQRGNNALPIIIGVAAIAGGIALVAANNGDNATVTPTTTGAP